MRTYTVFAIYKGEHYTVELKVSDDQDLRGLKRDMERDRHISRFIISEGTIDEDLKRRHKEAQEEYEREQAEKE